VLELSLFVILALFVLGGAVAMISSKQTLFSAFGFLVAMIGIGGMFALLHNQFLAIAQIMVAVGAVVVFSMLTILTVNAKEKNLPKEPHKWKWMLFSAVLVSPFTLLIYKVLGTLPNRFQEGETVTSKVLGKTLFSDWVLPFEILSILLLSAMLAAIVIARKHKQTTHKKQRRRTS